MPIDTSVARSRRALLAGGLGGLAAVAAAGIGRPGSVRAGVDGDVVLGGWNDTDAQTTVHTTSGQIAFEGRSFGDSAVGVHATSDTGIGVQGVAGSGTGVEGMSESSGWGVNGHSVSGTGTVGVSESGIGIVGQSNSNVGVSGISEAGAGVRGESTTGRGGVLVGTKAQLRLEPATAATHPTRGQRGDLFVDSTGRLWFCKGTTTWVKLA